MTAKTRLAVLVADYKDAVTVGDLDLQLEIKLTAWELDRANPDSPRAMDAMDAIRFVDRGTKTPAAQAA